MEPDEAIEIYVPAGTLTPYLKQHHNPHELAIPKTLKNEHGAQGTYQ